MYKKLVQSTFIFLFTLSSIIFILNISCPSAVAGILDCVSTSDVSYSSALNAVMLDSSVESSVINTEIVARRIGSGLATAGLGGVGTGIGLVFSGLIKGFSRNPSLKDDLFSYAIFGFALTEAIGLFALMMAFMLLYA